MRLSCCLLLAAMGLLGGCADRPPVGEAQFGVHVGYLPVARHTVDHVGRASDAVPSFNMTKACRASERNSCLRDEQDAKADVQRRWHGFSATERSACMLSSTGGIEPSYAELLTCLEMGALAKAGPATVGYPGIYTTDVDRRIKEGIEARAKRIKLKQDKARGDRLSEPGI